MTFISQEDLKFIKILWLKIKKFLNTLNITFFERSVSVKRRQTYKKYNKKW